MADAITESQNVLQRLKEPFKPELIEWRATAATEKNGKLKVLVVPYVNARVIAERLDEAVGVYWKDKYETISVRDYTGFHCTLSLKIGDEWISKQDAAELPVIEPIKGGYSSAFKRAGAKWGIGRYLKDLPDCWVEVRHEKGPHSVDGNFKVKGNIQQVKGYFNTPSLPNWALPNNEKNNHKKQSQQQQQQPSVENNDDQSNVLDKLQANVHSALQYLQVPLNLVPQILEKSGYKPVQLEKASQKDLENLLPSLEPAYRYVEYCRNKLNLTDSQMLYYANINLAPLIRQQLIHIYELALYLTPELTNTTIILAKEDLATIQKVS
ncbi:Rad52/Rad22 family DNA repair protein [Psychrobacillus sp. FSL K6-2684]|uniref:Rad52/Rad22 family DNA repair protein n=1 Tax=unclassified Psychrobacillus TaxID=2636677 RepID=UPI0030FB838B